ncbi:DNA excision repair protein ERCC-6 [Halotydeus destructor]|nr:DNA excision repair protein ERCC-6 [Halotydeus destructor]
MLSSFKRTDSATSSELNHVNGSIVPTISNLKQEQLEKPEKSISGNITIAEKEKKNKKKGKKKGAVFEGERIKYLVKHDKKKYTEDTEMSKKQDDYVLKKLFKGNSVHSALQHDVIEGAANPDYAIVEREAEKVALAAINALKKSKADCFRASSGIPSWTGLNGHKKAPRQPGNNVATGESSSSLLTAIKSRHKLDNLEDDDGEHPGAFVEPQNKELIENIRTFVASRPFQQAHTNEVLDKFKDALPIHQTPVFKALLNNLCSFARRSDGVGIWTLKSEFS